MIRTQISLTTQEYQLAKQESKRLGISLAEYFRRGLRAILPVRQKSNKSWMRYCGDLSSGKSNSNQEIDEVVYGRL